MPIPQSEINAWGAIFAEELATTPGPFYGVNEYDVPVENWEPFKANLLDQYKYVQAIGGQHHFWAVRDHGAFKRVIWINYYPNGPVPAPDVEDPVKMGMEGMLAVAEGHKLINRYNWYTANEVSGEPDALF